MNEIHLNQVDRDASRQLLEWFSRTARLLPWRQLRSPWRTWVSEVMLQQTRVDTVIPYFERFIRRFPDPAALAAADLDEVLRFWQGLGYYGRCRNLHAAAGRVVAEHGGEIPLDPQSFHDLPGVGDYMTAAVLSISCGWPQPALDGNLLRVGSRWFEVRGALQSGTVRRVVREAYSRLIPAKNPGDFNEALMDIGATLCLPRIPRCDECPLRSACRASIHGLTDEIPPPAVKKKIPEEQRAVFMLRDEEGKLLFRRRPARGIWGGLWELPQGPVSNQKPAAAGHCLAGLGCAAGKLVRVGKITHLFSHLCWQLHIWAATLSASPVGEDWCLVHPEKRSEVALPAAMERIIQEFTTGIFEESE